MKKSVDECEASANDKDGEIESIRNTIDGMAENKIKQRYQVQSEYVNTKAESQTHYFNALMAAYAKGAVDGAVQEGTQGQIDTADYEIT
jgi:hypothetical protein